MLPMHNPRSTFIRTSALQNNIHFNNIIWLCQKDSSRGTIWMQNNLNKIALDSQSLVYYKLKPPNYAEIKGLLLIFKLLSKRKNFIASLQFLVFSIFQFFIFLLRSPASTQRVQQQQAAKAVYLLKTYGNNFFSLSADWDALLLVGSRTSAYLKSAQGN